MERLAQLIKTAEEIRRTIWASLPFSERFAEVMYRLATSSSDAFGVGIYKLFLENGVEGMPDINGRPASGLEGRLPPHYGRDFGKQVFHALMRTHHNPNTVEDIMSGFLLRFMERADRLIKPGTKLRQAEGYVMMAVKRDGISLLRRKRWETPESQMGPRYEESDGPGYLDMAPAPPIKVTQEEAFLSLLERPDIRAKLNKIHPSAEEYVRLMLDGYKDVQILPAMLTHKTMGKGSVITAPKWTPIKNQIARVLAEAYDGLDIAV